MRYDSRIMRTYYFTNEESWMVDHMFTVLNHRAGGKRYIEKSSIVGSAIRRLYEEKFARTPSYVIPGAEPHSTEDVVDEP